MIKVMLIHPLKNIYNDLIFIIYNFSLKNLGLLIWSTLKNAVLIYLFVCLLGFYIPYLFLKFFIPRGNLRQELRTKDGITKWHDVY